MSLAGGLQIGDRVLCRDLLGTVCGKPARAAAARLSVAIRYDDGRIADERVANIELLLDDDDASAEAPPMQMRDDMQGSYPAPEQDPQDYPTRVTADDDRGYQGREDEEQAMASRAMWAEPPAQPRAPAVFAGDDAPQEASPDQSPDYGYDDRRPDEDARQIPANSMGPGTRGYGPDEAEAALREKIYANYEDLRAAFRALDQSNNGFVTREDFFQAMGNIFLNNGFSEDDIYEVADRFDLNKDGYISYNEFVAVVEGDQEEQAAAEEKPAMDDPRIVTAVELAIQKFKSIVDQRYTSIRKAFLDLDTERRGSLTPPNFAKGLVKHGIYLAPPELELAWSLFDRSETGVVSYADFCNVMTNRLQFGNHLGRQMFQ